MCGVFGIRAPERDVARVTYFGLFSLQHRGQESAGIAVSDRGRLTVLRDMGLVTQVFDEQKLRGLHGDTAIGHTRYSTTGSTQWTNAQPLIQRGRGRTVALGHNGNLVNATELREELAAEGITLTTTSDTELIAALIANDEASLEDAVAGAMARLDEDGVRSRQAVEPAEHGALCIFEFFYLARPDTRLDGVEVHGARVRMGERLAREAPVEADLVLPIPDSGTPAAIGFSRATGIPFSEGLIKNRYVHRTFIQPDQGLREQGVKLKFNPLAEVAGKRVVAVDDSIVRGNTTRKIVAMLFEAGAAEVHVRVSAPPVIGQCFYGIDLAAEDEMIAATRSVEEIREHIGATSLAYLSLEGLEESTRRPPSELCRACLTRDYPTAIPREGAKLRFEPARV
jgi:amidophosphoribosyltransferase